MSLVSAGLTWLAACCVAAGSARAEDIPRVVAYVASWSIPATIDAAKITHINFAFAHINGRGEVALDDPQAQEKLKRLLDLKRINPQLKVLVSVGGWQAEGFSDASLTESSRQAFAHSAVKLLRELSLDGIDLDWEYPGQGIAGIKYRAEDKHHFTELLRTLREEIEIADKKRGGPGKYLLTIAAADREYFDHTEMDKLHGYLDWINVMSYDFFNSLTPTTGHHAGLYRSSHAAATDRNADAAIKQYLAAGVPAHKLVLGVAFYGRGFAGVQPQNRGLNQRYERFEAEHSYAELVEKFIGKQGFERFWDETAQAPYLWNAASRTFITYDDVQSIGIKAGYVSEHRLGGMMFWELSQDHEGELLSALAHVQQLDDSGSPPHPTAQ